MDIFSFLNPTDPTLMEQGKIINGITSKMWIERYAESGEFTFKAPVSSGLKELLPIGSFVSHTDTPEVMIVENHEINDQEDQESTITVTGRGYETYLEQRIIGSNRVFPKLLSNVTEGKFLLPAQKTWDQIVHLISQHISAGMLADDNNSLPHVIVDTFLTGPGENSSRYLDTRDLYSSVIDLMKIDDLGIKIVRPGVWSPLGASSPNVAMLIHKGVDRTATIVFSYLTGEIVNADYLWSNKKLKTSALVTGKWVQTIYNKPGITKYRRRMMEVDASDLDELYDTPPDDFAFAVFNIAMKQRGKEELAKQKDVNLTKAEVSKKSVYSQIRVDFNVGDLVTVAGDYNESSVMRVSEFVEIEDENGTVAYPTLTLKSDEEDT